MFLSSRVSLDLDFMLCSLLWFLTTITLLIDTHSCLKPAHFFRISHPSRHLNSETVGRKPSNSTSPSQLAHPISRRGLYKFHCTVRRPYPGLWNHLKFQDGVYDKQRERFILFGVEDDAKTSIRLGVRSRKWKWVGLLSVRTRRTISSSN